ncbi:NIPSNAP family protein [Paraburkholderia sp. Ac-20336]|uniref:NIPSNAP family protein n=1 Tax=Burkholderiaceae TaxID=119060 RepID=UPI00141FE7E3|nr:MULTISPECIES: NIPSNAP family protein [Burkholderiaceae]MBN3801451.1 NIPSNAP family protein [Paraburkholderia sp. Ac-20336]MBN3846002.1 NIPSNAP family protein [Paraburkholderia sp. Ac-20342]NIF54143.1 NIPSNAP family protein [Burkholderia sp. Ax-1724]
MFYELTTMTLRFGTVAKASVAADAYARDAQARGTLYGIWFSDIGDLNQMAVLRGFETAEEMLAERKRTLLSADPFGCGEWLVKIEMHSYEGFAWMPAPTPGEHGKVYEIRTYEFKTGGLGPTLSAWERDLPARQKVSPCVAAMFAYDGTPRFTQIWPYASLDERAAARADSVSQGIWPPKGGPDWLTTSMRSQVFVPTAVSPLK